MPTKEQKNAPAYNPSQEDKDYLQNLVVRLEDIKNYRAALKANPYDTSPEARTIEETWDFCDHVALPHKYHDKEMQGWECTNSRPLIYSKLDTALSLLIRKNPEAELTAANEASEKKTQVIDSLYHKSWDKGLGQQQMVKFAYSCMKYGFAAGREYHLYITEEREEVVGYDPDTLKHVKEKKKRVLHDCPYFEVLPIRQCYFDNRAKPYDLISMRDWYWYIDYDESTFKKLYPKEKYPNAQYVIAGTSTGSDKTDKADIQDVIPGNKVRLYFYENVETNEFAITDKMVLIYKDILPFGKLSCFTGMWRIRNDQTIYGIGLPEILENSQELVDKISNMTINQIMLAISGSGFYGGTGNIEEADVILAPKLKKLRDAEKIVFPKIPMPGADVWKAIESIYIEADEMSGVTKSLSGESVGKTLGEAVLNKEAGLARLSQPLQNIEFALEQQGRLRVRNIQYIYSKPVKSEVVRNDLGMILDEKLWNEYLEERQKLGSNSTSFIQKFPEDLKTGAIYKNSFRTERLPLEKTPEGEVQKSGQDQWLEITPETIDGEYDIRIKAFSTIPMSKALEESRALETFNIMAKMPYVDLYKLEKNLLKKRGEDPDDVLVPEEQIATQQQQAETGREQQAMAQQEQQQTENQLQMAKLAPNGGAETVVPASALEQPASAEGLSQQISNSLQV